MGNADIRDLAVIDSSDLESLAGKTVAVDGYGWLYKYLKITKRYTDSNVYTTDDGKDLAVVIGCIRGLQRFFEHNITPVFVLDGDYHSLKEEEVSDRVSSRKSAEEDYQSAVERGDIIEAAKHESRSGSLTDEMVEEIKTLFDYADIEYFTAPQSGESQAAYMAKEENQITATLTDDYDALLFGSPTTIRNFTNPDNLEQMTFEETLEKWDVSHEQLVSSVLLCGTDYTDGLYGYGPKTSIKKIKEQSLEEILMEEDISKEEQQRYLTAKDIFLDPAIKTEYTIPDSRPQPDVDSIRSYISSNGLGMDAVSSALDTIEEQSVQQGLDAWG